MLSNPILIGALTVLATIAAVTLAYQANNGLPFVPKYHLNLQIRNASELTHGAEVHMGGALVGNVTTITAARDAKGQPIALLKLSLNKTVQPLPADSTFNVRLKGAIGLKYLEVNPGTSVRTFPSGATVPVSQASSEVDLDQVLSMFDPKTAEGIRETTIGFSDALAGRGTGINNAIGAFVPLLRNLLPVATNLASRQTDLAGFFRGLESFSGAVAPVAQTQADLYVNLDTTFRALAPVAVPFLQNWISETPPTFQTVISDSPSLQAFLLNTAGLFSELRPGFATLNQSAPVLADAFAAGTKNLPGTTALNARLVTLAKRLQTYGETPAVNQGLDRITATVKSLRSPLGVPHAGPDDVQLRVAVPAEHGKFASGAPWERNCAPLPGRHRRRHSGERGGSVKLAVPRRPCAQPGEQRGQRPAAHESRIRLRRRRARHMNAPPATSRTRRAT